jgi:hypothetical protein
MSEMCGAQKTRMREVERNIDKDVLRKEKIYVLKSEDIKYCKIKFESYKIIYFGRE